MVDLVARELRSHGFVIKPAEPALG
jgi:hypothetical protein